jgi:2-polyprenyl-3-methyl-5-hydroxy-6-metoxy-1,4-benzoquinol methylase
MPMGIIVGACPVNNHSLSLSTSFSRAIMGQQLTELLEQVRQQYDFGPYPHLGIECSPKNDLAALFEHSVTTPFYRRHKKIWHPQGKMILDAGCGTGYGALSLALANPGAKVIGIDLSAESVRLAKQRLEFHGIDSAEFYQMEIAELAATDMRFDYINCDEVLYIQEDQVSTLLGLKALLRPKGIIRSNLHNIRQRRYHFQAQELFRYMGLMDSNPEEMEMEIVQGIFQELKDGTLLKQRVWNDKYSTGSVTESSAKERILMNLLFQGDKGFTVLELFEMLEASELNLFSMVNWSEWDLLELFKDAEDLPAFIAMNYEAMSLCDRLNIYDLLNSNQRLLDFWCDAEADKDDTPISEWTPEDWRNSTISLHPVWQTEETRGKIHENIRADRPTVVTDFFRAGIPKDKILQLDSLVLSILLPLWNGPQKFESLVERYLKIKPIDPVTFALTTEDDAGEHLKAVIRSLEQYLYLLVAQAIKA